MSRMGRLLLKILIMCPFVVLLSSCYGDCFFDNLNAIILGALKTALACGL